MRGRFYWWFLAGKVHGLPSLLLLSLLSSLLLPLSFLPLPLPSPYLLLCSLLVLLGQLLTRIRSNASKCRIESDLFLRLSPLSLVASFLFFELYIRCCRPTQIHRRAVYQQGHGEDREEDGDRIQGSAEDRGEDRRDHELETGVDQ